MGNIKSSETIRVDYKDHYELYEFFVNITDTGNNIGIMFQNHFKSISNTFVKLFSFFFFLTILYYYYLLI